MRILVTFAVEVEFAPWRKMRNLQAMEIVEIPVFRAQVGGAQVDFVITGMGVENAFRVANKLLAEPYQVCITAGFAGALQKAHAVGHILVADAIRELGKSKTLSGDRNLVYAAAADGALRVKLFLTSDHVVRTAEEKKALARFADAVEMESFGVLTAAAAHQRSAVAIRVISDLMRTDMPPIVDTAVDELGRVRIVGVAKYVARHPLHLPALIRLGRDSKTAAEALAHYLETFIKNLSLSAHGWPPSDLQGVAAR